MTSAEGFLFNVDKVITGLDTNNSTFDWLSRTACEDSLKIKGDTFRDVQLLLGSTFLPAFPLLERPGPHANSTIIDAIGLLNRAGRSVLSLCDQYQEDAQVQKLQYGDRYKKAIMTIKHHVVLEKNGIIAPLDFERAPGDVHEFVGQKLPDELFFYISKGMLGPQLPNWLTSGEINLILPGGVLDTEPYRRLIIEQLNPLRSDALKVLAESLHFYYQNRQLRLQTWDERDTADLAINLRQLPSLKAKAITWRLRDTDLPSAVAKDKVRC